MSTAQTIGALPKNVKATPVEAGDRWADSAYFGPGLDADTEHMRAFPIGMVVAGILHKVRETKAEAEADRRTYLCLEDFAGNLFRVAAPGQLVYLTEGLIGKAISITYKGKERVERLKRDVHQFEVAVLEKLQ